MLESLDFWYWFWYRSLVLYLLLPFGFSSLDHGGFCCFYYRMVRRLFYPVDGWRFSLSNISNFMHLNFMIILINNHLCEKL